MTATTFAYKVRDRNGKLVEGSLEASDAQLVVAKLREMGYVPVSVKAKARSGLSTQIRLGSPKVKLRDLVVFSRQLATMINAGLSLLRALTILSDQTSSATLAKVIDDLRSDVENGQSFSEALARHPKVFSPMYQGLVRAGESGGSLDAVMERLATTIEMQAELRGKIKSAMSYPIAVAGLVVVIVTAMLIFVVPMFETMYRDLGGTLPLPTRLLLKMSGLVTSSWYFLIAGSVASVIGFRKWLATTKGRARFDAFKIRMPVFGTMIHKTALARFTRTFSSLMRSGVPVLETLDIVAGTAGNQVVAAAVLDAKDRVRMGEGIAAALGAHKVIPSMVTQMIAVGEETGALDEMLGRIADYYEREVEATVDSLTSLIEPLLMVMMGVSVGGMVIALYMPMFQIINLVK